MEALAMERFLVQRLPEEQRLKIVYKWMLLA